MRKALALLLLLLMGLAMPASAADQGAAPPADQQRKTAVHKITQSKTYLEVDPIYASILDGDRPLGLLMVGIGLDVPNAGLRHQVKRALPQLRDLYVRSLMAFAATSVRTDRQPDVVAIANRLQRVTNLLLARKGARILLAQVAIRLNR